MSKWHNTLMYTPVPELPGSFGPVLIEQPGDSTEPVLGVRYTYEVHRRASIEAIFWANSNHYRWVGARYTTALAPERYGRFTHYEGVIVSTDVLAPTWIPWGYDILSDQQKVLDYGSLGMRRTLSSAWGYDGEYGSQLREDLGFPKDLYERLIAYDLTPDMEKVCQGIIRTLKYDPTSATSMMACIMSSPTLAPLLEFPDRWPAILSPTTDTLVMRACHGYMRPMLESLFDGRTLAINITDTSVEIFRPEDAGLSF